jgi:hypothetical protein
VQLEVNEMIDIVQSEIDQTEGDEIKLTSQARRLEAGGG